MLLLVSSLLVKIIQILWLTKLVIKQRNYISCMRALAFVVCTAQQEQRVQIQSSSNVSYVLRKIVTIICSRYCAKAYNAGNNIYNTSARNIDWIIYIQIVEYGSFVRRHERWMLYNKCDLCFYKWRELLCWRSRCWTSNIPQIIMLFLSRCARDWAIMIKSEHQNKRHIIRILHKAHVLASN